MSPFSRTVLILGTLVASVPTARAESNPAAGFFTLPSSAPVKPAASTILQPASDAAATTAVLDNSRGRRWARRGRKTRFARMTHRDGLASRLSAGPAPADPAPAMRGSMAPGEEQAAATPADPRSSPATGPRENASPTLDDLVAKHAQENGVPFGLAKAVVRIESRGNPRASNGGALGLMQIKPGTARSVGFSGGASALFGADTNLHYGMKVLGDAFRSSGGDVCRALMLYQSGHLATHMSRANRAYCSRARAVMAGA